MEQLHIILQDLKGFTDIGLLIVGGVIVYFLLTKSNKEKEDNKVKLDLKKEDNKAEHSALDIIATDLKSLRDEVNKNTILTSEVSKSVNNKKLDEPTIREEVRTISKQVNIIDKKLDTHIGIFFEKFASGDLRFKEARDMVAILEKRITDLEKKKDVL